MKGIFPSFVALILFGAITVSTSAQADTQSSQTEQSVESIPLDETFSDPDMERKYLSMLVNELDGLEYLIKKAELAVDRDERVQFQYQWLRRDLAVMKVGIENHIKAPRTAPRKVESLAGDYRQ